MKSKDKNKRIALKFTWKRFARIENRIMYTESRKIRQVDESSECEPLRKSYRKCLNTFKRCSPTTESIQLLLRLLTLFLSLKRINQFTSAVLRPKTHSLYFWGRGNHNPLFDSITFISLLLRDR